MHKLGLRFLSLALGTALLAVSSTARGNDRHGDPLPPGAITRLGTTRPVINRPGRLVLTPDRKFVTTFVVGRKAGLFDPASGVLARELPVPPKHLAIKFVVAASGRWAAALADDGSLPDFHGGLLLWNLADGGKLRHLAVGQGKRFPRAVGFAANEPALVTVDPDATVRWWDPAKAKETRKWEALAAKPALKKPQGRYVQYAQVAPDGKRMAAVWAVHADSYSTPPKERIGARTFVVWDIDAEKELWSEEFDGEHYPHVAFSPDSSLLVSNHRPGTTFVFDTASGKERAEFGKGIDTLPPNKERNETDHWHHAFSPSGRTVAVYDPRHGVEVRDAATGKLLHLWKHPESGRKALPNWVSDPCPLDDAGNLLVMMGEDLCRVDAMAGTFTVVGDFHRAGPTELAFTADGKGLLARVGFGYDHRHECLEWDLATARVLRRTRGPDLKQFERVLANSLDCRVVAVTAGGGEVRLYSGPMHKTVHVFKAKGTAWTSPLLSPDGRWAVLPDEDRVELFDVAVGKAVTSLQAAFAGSEGGFTSDGKRLGWVDTEGNLRVYDTASGKCLSQMPLVNARTPKIVLSADGSEAVVVDGNREEVTVWTVATGKQRVRLNAKPRELTTHPTLAATLAPDGTALAVSGLGDDPRAIEVYELASGKVRQRFAGHDNAGIDALAFSPDGQLLASGGRDNCVLVWKVNAP